MLRFVLLLGLCWLIIAAGVQVGRRMHFVPEPPMPGERAVVVSNETDPTEVPDPLEPRPSPEDRDTPEEESHALRAAEQAPASDDAKPAPPAPPPAAVVLPAPAAPAEAPPASNP